MITKNFSIATDRMLLALIDLSYKDDIFREFTPEVARFLYPQPSGDIADTVSFINESREKTLAGRELQLVALDKDSKEFLGCAGLHDVDTRVPELGLWFKKSVWGKGYGLEAMRALKEWADHNLDYDHIRYPVYKDNAPSRKIAGALGGIMVREYMGANMKGEEHEEVDYIIPKS
ncbi:MAG: GNAT family N-acetyltransferase [Candidatus Falkowbacteria bacterium]